MSTAPPPRWRVHRACLSVEQKHASTLAVAYTRPA